jgi:hypothetical protein
MPTIIAAILPIKKLPSEIIENNPARKMMMTANAVKTSGIAPSKMFPIRLGLLNGPKKKLEMAVSGSLLTQRMSTEINATDTTMANNSFKKSTSKSI